MSTDTERRLDGNAAAGEMSRLFAFDITAAQGKCASCGDERRFAEALLFTDAPGLVARCASCEGIMLRMVRAGARTLVDMRGLSYICVRDTGQ